MSEDKKTDQSNKNTIAVQRRNVIKKLLIGSGSVALASNLPETWTKPVTKSVVLPAEGAPISLDN